MNYFLVSYFIINCGVTEVGLTSPEEGERVGIPKCGFSASSHYETGQVLCKLQHPPLLCLMLRSASVNPFRAYASHERHGRG